MQHGPDAQRRKQTEQWSWIVWIDLFIIFAPHTFLKFFQMKHLQFLNCSHMPGIQQLQRRIVDITFINTYVWSFS